MVASGRKDEVQDSSQPSDLTPERTAPTAAMTRKRVVQGIGIAVVLVVAVYVLAPRVLGLEGTLKVLGKAEPGWLAVALGFTIAAFASYVLLFAAVIGRGIKRFGWRESYQVTMAGLSATLLFGAGGAGGIFLTYWALRKAGTERRLAVGRIVAFLVILYSVYMGSLVVFGTLLRSESIPGGSELTVTLIPAGLAALVIAVVLAMALVPVDLDRRRTPGGRVGDGPMPRRKFRARLAAIAPTASVGVRDALAFARSPGSAALALGSALWFWAANVGVLWAALEAFGVRAPVGVLVQGFFVGMAANLFPLAPGGVGAVDAGLIGALVLFDIPANESFAAILLFRAFTFWFPIPLGVAAFLGLRRTVARWERADAHTPKKSA